MGDVILVKEAANRYTFGTLETVHEQRDKSGRVYADVQWEVSGAGKPLNGTAQTDDDRLVGGSRRAMQFEVIASPPPLALRSGLSSLFWVCGEPLERTSGKFSVEGVVPIGILADASQFDGLSKLGRMRGISLFSGLKELPLPSDGQTAATAVNTEANAMDPCLRLSFGQPFCFYNEHGFQLPCALLSGRGVHLPCCCPAAQRSRRC